jgi:hypothetical protein
MVRGVTQPSSAATGVLRALAAVALGVVGFAVAGLFVADVLLRTDVIACIELECILPPVIGFLVGAAAGLLIGIAVAVIAVRRSSWRGPIALGGFALVSGALLVIERATR